MTHLHPTAHAAYTCLNHDSLASNIYIQLHVKQTTQTKSGSRRSKMTMQGETRVTRPISLIPSKIHASSLHPKIPLSYNNTGFILECTALRYVRVTLLGSTGLN